MGDTIAIPLADDILLAYANGDHEGLLSLIDRSPLEAWFGVPPDRMRPILDSLPAQATATSIVVRAMRLLLNGEDAASLGGRVSKDAARAFSETVAAAFGARLHGAPQQSVRWIEQLSGMLSTSNSLFDETGGWGVFGAVQRGIGLMLAGELEAALEAFAIGTGATPPATLTVLLRDAYVKSALLHALYGDPAVASAQLDVADGLPLTASWAEPIVAAHAAIALALLAPDVDLDAAIAAVERIPVGVAGELWPFRVLALRRLYARADRLDSFAQVLSRERASAPAHAPGEGVPSSALTDMAALAALHANDLDEARRWVEQSDPTLISTELTRSMVEIETGVHEAAARRLVHAHARTEHLRQLEIMRLGLLALALLVGGDEDGAHEAITRLRAVPGGIGETEAVLLLEPVRSYVFDDGDEHPASAVRTLSTRTRPPRLTPGERRLLDLLPSERTRAQIAEALFVSVNTVKSQQRSLFRKLGVPSRTDAVLAAERLGLL